MTMEETMLMRSVKHLPATAILAILLISPQASVRAQTTTDPHHPQGTPAITVQAPQPLQMQPGSGMGSQQKPGGMMGDMMRNMMPDGGMMGRDCPMIMGEGGAHTFGEGRIAFLKAELAVTEPQKEVWDIFAAALKKNFTSMQGMRQRMMTAAEGKTLVERLDERLVAMESRHEALKGVKPALAALYKSLSDEQKKKAEQILTGMGCMA
jgi:hypothetical protein